MTSTKITKFFLASKIAFGSLSVLLWGMCVLAYAAPESAYHNVWWFYIMATIHSALTVIFGCLSWANVNDLRSKCSALLPTATVKN